MHKCSHMHQLSCEHEIHTLANMCPFLMGLSLSKKAKNIESVPYRPLQWSYSQSGSVRHAPNLITELGTSSSPKWLWNEDLSAW